MLIVRAPLQLFQAIQTSILPHLAGLQARESADEFQRAVRVTILAIAAFAAAVALGLLLIGPAVMTALLGDKGYPYGRVGLALVGVGMGLHLDLRDAQPGRAGARVRALGVGSVADLRRAVRRVRRQHPDLERGHPSRGRLLRRDRGAVRDAGRGLPARSEPASVRRPGGRRDRGVSGGGILGAEHRRAGHEEVRPGAHDRLPVA